MELEKIIMYLLGGTISIVIYFLKGVIESVKEIKKEVQFQEIDIKILQNNHNHLSNKIDDVNINLKELTNEIKSLRKDLN